MGKLIPICPHSVSCWNFLALAPDLVKIAQPLPQRLLYKLVKFHFFLLVHDVNSVVQVIGTDNNENGSEDFLLIAFHFF